MTLSRRSVLAAGAAAGHEGLGARGQPLGAQTCHGVAFGLRFHARTVGDQPRAQPTGNRPTAIRPIRSRDNPGLTPRSPSEPFRLQPTPVHLRQHLCP